MKRHDFNIMRSPLAPFVALLVNILLAFGLYIVARIEFLFENYNYFCAVISPARLWRLFYGGYMFDRSAIIYTNALYIVMMLFPLWIKETPLYHKICKWVFVLVNSLTLIINLGDSVYFPYTLRRTTTSVFSEFKNENNLGDVFWGELLEHWYLVLLAAGLIFLMWKLYVTPKVQASQYASAKQRVAYSGIQLLMLAVITPFGVAACRGGLDSAIRPITISNANEYVERPTECALVLNTPFALIRTIGKSVFTVPEYFKSQEELEKVFTPIHNIHKPSALSALDAKNVVILIVESFGREYIGALNKELEDGNYKGYTPNVDKLIEQSVTYKYSYCNGRKSIDGMPSVLCGIPMFVEPFVLSPQSMNTYTGLAGILSNEGYNTAFFHGANRGSMGFLAFAKKTGFKEYYGREDYVADPRFGGDADFDGHWGIWDEPFLQYYCAKMSEMKQPFMTTVFTVSSHPPYVIPE